MTSGTYFDGKRWVSAEEFRRPPPGKPKPTPKTPQPKETTNVDKQ